MGEHIRVARENGVGTLTIARRERFNSLDVETAQDLRRAGLSLARDEEIRAVVLRGEGGVFCSGADLKYIRGGGDERGLGYLVQFSGAQFDAAGVFAVLVVIALLAVALNVAVEIVQDRVERWRVVSR